MTTKTKGKDADRLAAEFEQEARRLGKESQRLRKESWKLMAIAKTLRADRRRSWAK